MFKYLLSRNLARRLNINSQLPKRFFLSESFKCTEEWENRLKSPTLQQLRLGSLYAHFESIFNSKQLINVVDVDLFVNGMTDNTFERELESILKNVRQNPETTIVFESTTHAVIRWYLANNKKSELLSVLGQRMIFGIFPDIYLSILMQDMFLKENDYIAAVKIPVLQMLQEDCNYPILRTLSLYSCMKYLKSPDVWESPQPDVVDEDEEVIKVRAMYARNEYFDDHFDITDTNHLVGKTLIAYGKTIDGPVGISSQLLGLVLYEKFDDTKLLLTNIIEKKVPVYKEVVEMAKSYIKAKPKQMPVENSGEEEKDSSDSSESSENSENVPESKIGVEKLLNELDSSHLLTDDMLGVLKKYVEKEVQDHEKSYIENQCKLYKQWENEREENIKSELLEEEKKKVRMDIEKQINEMKMEEQKLFYFTNEDSYNEIIEQNRIARENVKYFVPRRKVKPAYKPPLIKE